MEETRRVQDFLHVFQGKSKSETCELIKSYKVYAELVEDIINIIEWNHASQICDTICEVLFNLNSCGQEEGSNFSLQFIPALIWAYYSLMSKNVKWSSSKVETLLLFIYNQIVQTNKEIPFSTSFSIPTLSKPSIYHEPMMGVSSLLTEHTLSQHDKVDKPILIKGPIKFLDKIPAGFRSLVIKCALKQYNDFLSFCFVPSLVSFCRVVIRLSSCGFPFVSYNNDFISAESLKLLQNYPKVRLNGDVMKEMVTALHFIAFNGCADIAVTAMKCLHRKACYSICTAAVLATEAVQDIISLSANTDGCKFEHSSPVNPYTCNYRVENLTTIQKRKFLKVSQSTPRVTRPLDVTPLRPSETSSPKSTETIRCIPSPASSSIQQQRSVDTTEDVFIVDKKNDSIDGTMLNETTETDISGHVDFNVGSQSFDHNDRHDDKGKRSTSFIELALRDTPKIVIDFSGLCDEKISDEVPLIGNRKQDSSVEESDDVHTSFSPLNSEGDSEVRVNGDVAHHVYDTQL